MRRSREDKKTRDIALIETTRDISTLGELLEYCQSIDVCKSSVEFWRESLTRLFGNIIVLQRGDLQTAEEWHEFAQRLAEGVTYKYTLEEGTDGTWGETPHPYYLIHPDQDREDYYYDPFEIPGMVPNEGVRGYYVRLVVDGDYYQEERSFFVHEDQTIAKRYALRFIGEKYHSILNRMAYGIRNDQGVTMIKITSEPIQSFNDLARSEPIPVPPAEYFVKTLLANDKMTWFTIWESPKGVEVESEMFHYITPITF